VEIDARGYCVLPWLDGAHPAGTDLTHEQVRQLGVVVGRLHQELNEAGSATGLPALTSAPTAPVVPPADAITEAVRFQTAASAAGGPFDTAVINLLDQRIALIHRYAAARPTNDHPTGPHGWTHGDLQYRNIIWTGGAIGAVIDWDRIRIRPFAQEIARTATIQFATPDGLDLDRVIAFIEGYRCVIPIADGDLIDGFHRLWWTRMSNFWQLVYHYDRGNDSCDDLFISGEELLHWWTRHSTEVHDAVRCGA
jgi:Ser/Thr protein kinase RdoA (MazF antagonist)